MSSMTFSLYAEHCQSLSERDAITALCDEIRRIDALPSSRDRFIQATTLWNHIDHRTDHVDEMFGAMCDEMPWFFSRAGSPNSARFTY